MQHNNHAQESKITADQVSEYLRIHPQFFEHHASLLTEIYLPSPHGHGTISLAERQQLAQRDKIRVLEVMLENLIKIGEENDVTSEKVHALSLRLIESQYPDPTMGKSGFKTMLQMISENMQQNFSVKQSIFRLWIKPSDKEISEDLVFTKVEQAFKDWVMALEAPFCGENQPLAGDLLEPNLKSFAFIPLYKKQNAKLVYGVLILGSNDPQRFNSGMGTLYLERLNELISAAILSQI